MTDGKPPSLPPRIAFLGLAFDPLDLSDCLAALKARAAEAPFAYVVTPNVDHMVRLEKEPALLPLYENAWLTVCDSKILAGLSRLSGVALPAAPGASLVQMLFEHGLDPQDRLAVVGGTAELMQRLKQQTGRADLIWIDAPMGLRHKPEAMATVAAEIAATRARYVLLCIGSPQQELLADAVRLRGDGIGIGLCCGASLEFLTGMKDRAPNWMQASGLEWLHRLLSEPKRMWRRYLIDGPKIFAIWWRSWGRLAG
jgi:exopolysaccharide biosynthesis WecB/TagA/CpsF family protein